MKNIYNYLFIYVFLFYLLATYFLFPIISSIINPTIIFDVTNEYVFIISFCILIFFSTFMFLKKNFPHKHKANEDKNLLKDKLMSVAYFFFIAGFFSKILNILNGDYKYFLYSNINAKFFFIEYFSSMNVLTLFSIFLFTSCFYNKKMSYNFFYFSIPILYLIFFIVFSPGGRLNLIAILSFVFALEVNKFSNLKLQIFKISTIIICFFVLFNFMTVKKDATLLRYIGIYVIDLNKETNFSEINHNDRKIYNVLLSKNFIFFTCEKNIEAYKDKSMYSKYAICKSEGFHDYSLKNKEITATVAINKTAKLKEITFNNSMKMGILSNFIYNITTRVNNYRPLSSALDLKNDNELEKRSILNEFKNIIFRYINVFLDYFNAKLIYERNNFLDNFNVKSGITKSTSEAGLSPTLIGDIYWLGGYLFLFLYFIKTAVVIYFLNNIFNVNNFFYKAISFFFFINYISTFEQSFEAHSLIFLNYATMIFFSVIIYSLAHRFDCLYLKK